MQRLAPGPLSDLVPKGSELWLDGGHNPAAARVVADALRELAHDDAPLLMVLGMLANKDAAGFLKPFAGLLTAVYPVPVPGHEHHSPKSEEHTSELQSLMRISYAVFCLKKNKES